MMPEDAPPGKGKFVKLGGTEDAQSFGPRWELGLEQRVYVRRVSFHLDPGDHPTSMCILTVYRPHTEFVRCILASGVSIEESLVIRSILEDDEGEQEGVPLVVSTPEIADKRVGDVLTDAPMISLLQVRMQIVLCTGTTFHVPLRLVLHSAACLLYRAHPHLSEPRIILAWRP